jgi:hypothetical protein
MPLRLSRLQQQILALAWERDQAPVPEALRLRDILERLWGWTLAYGHWKGHRSWQVGHVPVGEGAYHTAQGSVSRAISRLARRGLVTRHGGGVVLTETGRALAPSALGRLASLSTL